MTRIACGVRMRNCTPTFPARWISLARSRSTAAIPDDRRWVCSGRCNSLRRGLAAIQDFPRSVRRRAAKSRSHRACRNSGRAHRRADFAGLRRRRSRLARRGNERGDCRTAKTARLWASGRASKLSSRRARAAVSVSAHHGATIAESAPA